MAIKIRLTRTGAKKRPFYRIVVADARSPRDGRFIEKVGTYNPMIPKGTEDRVTVNEERIKYWLGVGAKPTDRVARFLSERGLVAKPVINKQTKKSQPKTKAVERAKAREEKLAAAAVAPASEETATEE